MWGTVSKALQRAGSCTLMCDYRNGTLLDYSGLNRTGVITAPVRFSRQGAHFSGVGRITHPDHASGRNTTGSVVMLGSFQTSRNLDERLFSAADAGGTRIEIVSNNPASTRFFGTAGTNTTVAGAWTNRKCLAVNYASGVKSTLWFDGVYSAEFAAALTILDNDAPIIIGAYFSGSTRVCWFPIACVLETNRPLTAAEHLAVYLEMASCRWPTQPWTRGVLDV